MKSKVLFVEDDPDQILIYQSKFELEGLSMTMASDSAEAMKLALSDKPGLILLDLLLQNENGLDLLAKLKAEPQTKEIPVIVFTNFDSTESRDRAKDLGALEYIVKTQTTPSEIIKKIRKIIG